MGKSQQSIQLSKFLSEGMQAYAMKALRTIQLSYQHAIRSWLNGRSIQSFVSLFLISIFLSIAVASCSGSSSASKNDVKLKLVSFSVTKAAHDQIIPKFIEKWKQEHNQNVTFEQSYGGSGAQAAAVGFPVSLAVAEEYGKGKPEAKVSVASSGTGGGFSKFCNGDIDIAGASRTIRDEEIKKCKSKNIEFVELPVALDGIAVIANRKNNFAKCLTIKELGKIWGAKSDSKILTWNQVNPKFPNEKLKLYAPASDTGTFDYMTQAVTGKAKNGRTDYTPSHNQNLLVQGVSGDVSALGYVGISYYIQNQDKLNLVAVESPTGKCEKPVPVDNVIKNIYTPLSRPLFLYVSKKSLDTKPAVKEFVDFYLENSWKWVDSVGYVALPDEAYVKVKQKFATGETGTKFKKAKPGEPITNFI